MKEDINVCFPELAAIGYEVTSEEDIAYNCIAWAAGDTSNWWECYEYGPVNSPGYYWPPGAKTGYGLDALINAFEQIRYTVCENGDLESGFEKVALYAKNGAWTHASRQLPEGSWTSKVGEWEDLRHQSPDDICGESYGLVACFMKRPA